MCRPYLESPAVPYSRCSRAHVAVAAYPALALVLNLILIFVVLFRFLFSLFTQLFVFFLRIKADKYDVAAWESLIVETSKVCHLFANLIFFLFLFSNITLLFTYFYKKHKAIPSPHTTPPAFSSTFLLVINARLLQLNIVHARGFYKRFLEVFPTASAHWKVYVTTSISTSRHETAPLTTRQYIYGYVEDLDGP